jgi:hypothetical protein
MPTVADVVRRHGPAYLERFDAAVPREHKKVLEAMTACQTGQLGSVIYQCTACRTTHAMGRSCGNRHCPTCQQDKAKASLENQTDLVLPRPYFLLTFTLPAGLRSLVRRHQRVLYAIMFEASSDAIKRLAADPKYLGTRRCGFFGVLHTWGRTLEYQPHLHYVVPGGGISEDGSRWLASRADRFVPVRALSIPFRAKFRAALDRAGLLAEVDPVVWRQDWVVHSQAVGDGRGSLKYLAPCVFRVALTDRRVVACANGKVAFSYRQSGSNRLRTMTVDAFELIHRFLQHVLPRRFPKVQHYGFLSPNSRESIAGVRWLVTLHDWLTYRLLPDPSQETVTEPRIRFAACGAPMRLRALLPRLVLIFDTS